MIGIIFDFNGTLYDDTAKQKMAWERMFEKYRHNEITSDEMAEHVHGRNNRHTLEYMMDRQLSNSEVDKYSDEKEALYRLLCKDDELNFHLREGVPEYLDALKDAKIPVTIATASGLDNVKFFFDSFGLSRWFDLSKVVYNDGSIKGKPKPDIFLKAAENIHVPIQKDIVFEDSGSGFAAAENAEAGWIVGVETSDNYKTIRSDKRLATVISEYTDSNKFLNADFLKVL